MAYIKQYETKSGTKLWMCQFSSGTDPLTGKVKRSTKRGFKTRRQAELAASRAMVNVDNYGYSEKQTTKFSEVYEYFIKSYKNTVKESTLNRVLGIFKHHILPIFGPREIKKITVPMCQEAVNKWSKELTSFDKIKDYASLVFKEAKRLKITYDNPMELIIMPHLNKDLVEQDNDNYWDKKQVQKFLKCLDLEYSGRNEKAVAFFRLALFTGARKGELLALTISDLDLKNNTLRINKTVSRSIDNTPIISTPKTKRSIRTIGLDKETSLIMKKWIIELRKEMFELGYNTDNSDQLLFPNTQNSLLSLTKANKWLDHICSKYDLKRITVHGLRHTTCSLLLEAGASIKEVQLQLGHSDASQILNVYWHMSKLSRKDTINKMANFVNM